MSAAGAGMIAIDDVLSRLEGVRPNGRGWAARCPAHRDRSPSLSVARGQDGRILLKCFAGCTFAEILRAIDIEPAALSSGAAHPPRSPFLLALEMARRQPWYQEETRLLYGVSDEIRRRRRAVAVARAVATRAGDRPEAWELLATAAAVERQGEAIEAQLDEAAR